MDHVALFLYAFKAFRWTRSPSVLSKALNVT